MLRTLLIINDLFSGSLDWRWIDGLNTDFSYWNKGQPDSKDQADYCALSWWSGGQLDGHWDDQPCSEISHAFICQKERSTFQFLYKSGECSEKDEFINYAFLAHMFIFILVYISNYRWLPRRV